MKTVKTKRRKYLHWPGIAVRVHFRSTTMQSLGDHEGVRKAGGGAAKVNTLRTQREGNVFWPIEERGAIRSITAEIRTVLRGRRKSRREGNASPLLCPGINLASVNFLSFPLSQWDNRLLRRNVTISLLSRVFAREIRNRAR